MSSRDNDGAFAILLFPVAAFLLFVFWLSRSLGADFQTTLGAVLFTIIFLGIAGAIMRFAELKLSVVFFAFAVVAWPCWWGVLDSIANQGRTEPELYFLAKQTLYTSGWFKWGIEVFLIAPLGYFASKGLSRYS